MTANVIDINQVDVSKIAKDEIFAIDTNVLIWTHYSKASNAKMFLKNIIHVKINTGNLR